MIKHVGPINVVTAVVLGAALLFSQTEARAQARSPGDVRKAFPEMTKDGAKRHVDRLRMLIPRIIGGVPAQPGEFPYQVSLMLSSKVFGGTGVERHFCGGSIVDNEWVITAAHCVAGFVGMQKFITVGSGSIDLDKAEEYELDGIWIHPNYDGEISDYDFAIIKVKNAFSDPAIDVVSKADNQHINVGDTATVTGWGVNEKGDIQQILLKTDVKVISRIDCNDADSYSGMITARMICLGLEKGGKDTCQGDSGGPAMKRMSNGAKVLFATTSWGEGCALPQKFGVYGRLISVRSWIESVIPAVRSRAVDAAR